MLNLIIAFSSVLAALGPSRSVHTDRLNSLLLRDPVGFVYDAHHENADKVVERLHDFRTGKDLLTLRGSAPYSFSFTCRPPQPTLIVMGVNGKELRVGSVVLRGGQRTYDASVVSIPVFDTGPPSPVEAPFTISLTSAFATATDLYLGYEGPRIVKLSRNNLKTMSRRTWGDSKSGAYNVVVEEWVFSPKSGAFAVGEEQLNGMILGTLGGTQCGSTPYDQTVFFGKYDGPVSQADGEASCVVPCQGVDGFWVIFTDGTCRQFKCDSHGRYLPIGSTTTLIQPKGEAPLFVPLQGVSDATHQCAYILTSDRRRIATVSIKADKPKVSYVELDRPAGKNFEMASAQESRWLAAIDTSIQWYEKRQGRLALRFTTRLPKGEGFNAIRQ